MTDEELLAYVADEKRQSVGFDTASDLTEQRERALEYAKGVMTDVPSLPNRSRAVSTDVDDAIQTLLPDLVEIFTGSDDVAVFVPQGEEDEEAAQQETDYINHVVFGENDGWMTLYTMFKDALLSKTGVVKFAWEDGEEVEEKFERRSAVVVQKAIEAGRIDELEQAEPQEGDEEPLFNFCAYRKNPGRIQVMAWPPEDFTVAADTVRLANATYCAARSRPRAQDLIFQGIDPDIVAQLAPFGVDEGMQQARDTVGENDLPTNGADNMLRRVEVVEHFIRVNVGGKPKLMRALTGNAESVLIEKEEIDRIPFAAITPYVITHRFYGESVADKLMELQRIKTALTRAAMDAIYFALNQRVEVSESDMSANTLPDLLRNEPGVPVRSKTGSAIRPIQAGGTGFDPFGALEYFETKVEQRTGIVRAAQGLTPDTLHETARGALALLTQAQKRVRLMARLFAETGIKDLFLGVHALVRKHGDRKTVARLRNKWVDIDPTSWGTRADMSIEIGVGAAGKEAQAAMMAQLGEMLDRVIAMQGGPTGPVVNVENVYNFVRTSIEKMGFKAPEKYVSDPKEAPTPAEPPPDPRLIEAQETLMLKREEAEANLRQKQENAASDLRLQEAKIAAQSEMELRKMEAEFALRREQIEAEMVAKAQQTQAELALKERTLEAELGLKERMMVAEMQLRATQAVGDFALRPQSADIGNVDVGGDPG